VCARMNLGPTCRHLRPIAVGMAVKIGRRRQSDASSRTTKATANLEVRAIPGPLTLYADEQLDVRSLNA
jgi:hypothetical protein